MDRDRLKNKNKITKYFASDPKKKHKNKLHITTKTLKKIISGGQTGADRAGLEEAFDIGFETGGIAPPKYKTSNGNDLTLKNKFGLTELFTDTKNLSKMYIDRSKMNVDMSDGTISFRTHKSSGTDKTINYCKTKKWSFSNQPLDGKPYRPILVIRDLSESEIDTNANKIIEFIKRHKIKTLNVCGHRESNMKTMVFTNKVRNIMKFTLKKYKNDHIDNQNKI